MKTIKRTINGKEYNVQSGLVKDIKDADNGLGEYSTTYVQVNLNKISDTIWGDFHCSLGRNSWNEYREKDIVCLGLFSDFYFKLSNLSESLRECEG